MCHTKYQNFTIFLVELHYVSVFMNLLHPIKTVLEVYLISIINAMYSTLSVKMKSNAMRKVRSLIYDQNLPAEGKLLSCFFPFQTFLYSCSCLLESQYIQVRFESPQLDISSLKQVNCKTNLRFYRWYICWQNISAADGFRQLRRGIISKLLVRLNIFSSYRDTAKIQVVKQQAVKMILLKIW